MLDKQDVNLSLFIIERDLMKNAEAWATSGDDYFKGQAVGCMHSYNTIMKQVDERKAQETFDEHFSMFWGKEVQDQIEQDCLNSKEAS